MNTAPDIADILRTIEDYENTFQKWEQRAQKIYDKYIDSKRAQDGTDPKSFNILWSNVQTLRAATFAKIPKPDVSRRFADQDPAGRVASLILERAMMYELEQYPDYKTTLKQCVDDRFLGGRGTAWARYEPHMRAAKQGLPTDGVEATEDVDEPQEELDYECAPVDYVNWRDFGHNIARTWEEIHTVWRKVYLTREGYAERFGEEAARTVQLDIAPGDKQDKNAQVESAKRALVYEVWHKPTKTAVWLQKASKEYIDERPDPLGLQNFFPCPRPLYATLCPDKLEPTPDYVLYQDQANELDVLADRRDGLIKALQVRGVYDASQPELSRLFSEVSNGAPLIPVNNWAAFAEKQGLKGAIDIVDLANIAQALEYNYKAFEAVKSQIYEITGISDIIRGQSVASETATAQQIKGQYASLRLKAYQDEVSEFATELLRLKAQIMTGKFTPQTLLSMSAVDQLNEADKQYIPEAVQLLFGERAMNPDADSPNPVRNFRIEVAADTLVHMDEQQDKQDRIEFLTAAAGFLKQAVDAGVQVPAIAPLASEMLKFGVGAFKGARQIEGVFDQTADQLKQAAQQPKPNPEAQKMQLEAAKAQASQQLEGQKFQAEQQRTMLEFQSEQRIEQMRLAMEARQAELERQREEMRVQYEAQLEQQRAANEQSMEQWKAKLDADTKIVVAAIQAHASMASKAAEAAAQPAEGEQEGAAEQEEGGTEDAIAVAVNGIKEALAPILERMSAPRQVIRDVNGRVTGIQ